MPRDHVHFVTGRLAEHSLRNVLAEMALRVDFDYSVEVLGISVAALMTPAWVARRLAPPPETTRVVLPGYCQGDLHDVQAAAGVSVDRGPKDLRDLPEWFQAAREATADYGRYDIEILAEINHAPRLTRDELLVAARDLVSDGADIIDIGCNPGETWRDVADSVRAMRDEGLRVSIDSMNVVEIEQAAKAGAELVLSVNSSNVERAVDWGCAVVAVPDVAETLAGLDDTVERLIRAGVAFRIDPIVEPIGFGFAPAWAAISRFGALSAGRNADGDRQLDRADRRRFGRRQYAPARVLPGAWHSQRAHHAGHQLGPHVGPRMRCCATTCLSCRDGPHVAETCRASACHAARSANARFRCGRTRTAAREIKDANFRIFVEGGELHLIAAGLHLHGADPYQLLEELQRSGPRNLDAGHAFYLGYELAKARTALTLGKDYRQDEALDWGLLTVKEISHRRRQAPSE